jgi:hypothetical protein
LLAYTRCRLNLLVVRRFAPNAQRVASAAIVATKLTGGDEAGLFQFPSCRPNFI